MCVGASIPIYRSNIFSLDFCGFLPWERIWKRSHSIRLIAIETISFIAFFGKEIFYKMVFSDISDLSSCINENRYTSIYRVGEKGNIRFADVKSICTL